MNSRNILTALFSLYPRSVNGKHLMGYSMRTDLNQLLVGEPTWLSKDGVHPTDEGNALIARFVGEAVTPLIEP